MSVLLTRPFERIGADSSGTAVSTATYQFKGDAEVRHKALITRRLWVQIPPPKPKEIRT
jgi:hypothetical protein